MKFEAMCMQAHVISLRMEVTKMSSVKVEVTYQMMVCLRGGLELPCNYMLYGKKNAWGSVWQNL